MSPAQNRLYRAAQFLIDRQDERRRAYEALIAAQHAEDLAHHELRNALVDFKDSIESQSVKPDWMSAGHSSVDKSGDGTSLTSDAAQALLQPFDGVRD